ncbi:MAG: DNA translocase FtsK [Clostridiales bacterium]|nr:DNA translocase FtsK [Clostridiales bacterium]
MIQNWRTPEVTYSRLYDDMLHQTHLLIAGATGAGKSTVVNGMIHAALKDSPVKVGFILIDPKGTELDEYKNLPHTLMYADAANDPKDKPMFACVNALKYAMQLYKTRTAEMKRRKLRLYDGSDIYVIIDELMQPMTRAKREFMPMLQDLLSLARCTRIHIVACTQSPVAQVIPTPLKCNFSSRLALRTVCAQDSRNIIGIKGCEMFPDPSIEHKALGMYMRGCSIETYKLPKTEDADREQIIDYWMKAKPKRRLFA